MKSWMPVMLCLLAMGPCAWAQTDVPGGDPDEAADAGWTLRPRAPATVSVETAEGGGAEDPLLGPSAGAGSTRPAEPAEPPPEPPRTLGDYRGARDRRAEIDALVAELATATPERLAAIEAHLAGFGPDVMVPLKLAELSDNLDARQRAVRLSARLRWRLACTPALLETHADLVDVMSGDDRAARAGLADAIARKSDADAIGFFGECLADSQDYVRQRALDGLAAAYARSYGSPSQQSTPGNRRILDLLRNTLRDEDRNMRLLAAGAMARLGAVALDDLSPLLDDASLEVRQTAILAVGLSEEPGAMELILPLLRDPEWRVRVAVLEAMDDLSQASASSASRSRVGQAAVDCLADPDPYVRAKAAALLGEWGYRGGAARIRELAAAGQLGEMEAYQSLAAMGDTANRRTMLEQLAAAETAERRIELLGVLAVYATADVTGAIRAALEDESLEPHWPRVIQLASRHAEKLMPLLTARLEHPNPDVAAAAWDVIGYRFSYGEGAPPGLASRLLATGEPRRAEWALAIAYGVGGDAFATAAVAALAYDSPEVVNLALGMLGAEYVQDPLDVPDVRPSPRSQGAGAAALEYLAVQSEFPAGSADLRSQAVAAARLPQAVVAALRGLLEHADPLVRTRVAALLYRAGGAAQSDAAVMDALRAGLAGDDPAIRSVALAGIVSEPGPFLDGFDLLAAGRDERLARRAAAAMAASGDARYADAMIDLAARATWEDVDLMRALIASNSDRAIELALSKVDEERSYESREFAATHLRGMSGPGAVRFLARAIDKLDRDDYNRQELVSVLLTLPDPSVRPALEAILADKRALREMYGVEDRVQVRLAVLDPQGNHDRVAQALARGETQVLQGLLAAEATAELAALVLEAAKTSTALPEFWQPLMGWLPPATLRDQFLPVLGELKYGPQQALLQRIGGDPQPGDLDRLLAVGVEDAFPREYVDALVADLTAGRPDGPDLAAMEEAAVAHALSAAADWPGGIRAIERFLANPRPAVSAAAVRGLAYYVLGHPGEQYGAVHRDALLAALREGDAVTSYLAAEALALRWRADLVALGPQDVPSLTAAMVRAAVMNEPPSAELRKQIAEVLGGRGGPTAMQFAAVAAARHWHEDYEASAGALLMQLDRGLLMRVAQASHHDALLRQLLRVGALSPGDPSLHPLVEPLLEKARADDRGLFAQLVSAGWIAGPAAGDLERLIAAAAYLEEDRSTYTPYGRQLAPESPALDRALAWAGAEPRPTVLEAADGTSASATLAAAVAAVAWGDADARTRVLETATRLPRRLTPAVQRRMSTALAALVQYGGAAEADALLAAVEGVGQDDYERRQAASQLATVTALIAPDRVVAAVAAREVAEPSDVPSFADESSAVHVRMQVSIVTADAPGWTAYETERGYSYDAAVSMAMLRALMEAKDAPVVPPALLPPWRTAGDDEARMMAMMSGRPLADDVGPTGSPDAAAEEVRTYLEEATAPAEAMRYSGGVVSYGATMSPAGGANAEPEAYHQARSGSADPALAALGPDALAELLRPYLRDGEWPVRRAAMRLAADGQVTALADDIAVRLDAEDAAEVVEAAWALALLRGPEAVEAIAAVHARTENFDTRVRLAAVLHGLGSDDGRADLDRAVALWTTRSFRLKFIDRGRRSTGGYNQGPYFDGSYYPGTHPRGAAPVVPVRERLLPWAAALETCAPELLRRVDERFAVPPSGQFAVTPEPLAAPGRVNLDGLHLLSAGRLGAALPDAFDLPLEPLAGDSAMVAEPFARLCITEQALERVCFVQFADVAGTPVDLRDRWRAWWAANRDASPDVWRRQAVEQATAELTHERWWHRLRAARRLGRLTGRTVTPPALFDRPAWQVLQEQWRAWLAGPGQQDPRLWLVQAGVDAGLLDPSAAQQASDDTVYLTALVRLAGFGDSMLSEAALVRLSTWPDREQLIRASLPWQHCPRRALAAWSRWKLGELTGKRRLVYVEADLAR